MVYRLTPAVTIMMIRVIVTCIVQNTTNLKELLDSGRWILDSVNADLMSSH